MGILDDAIRQHLDLKRQRGATESELKQLEDEAFGPPSRPGEPDFPGEEAHDQNGNGAGAEAAVPEPEVPTGEPSPDAEPSASEHQVVEAPPEETNEPPGVQDELEAPEPTPESEELTAIYDQTADREVDVAEELEEPEAPPPIESLDTVEHSIPEEAVEPELAPAAEPGPEDEGVPAAEEQEELPIEEEHAADEEPHPDQAEGEEGGDADVLADTPEFLKDAPEDDELWFEQGEPKDFDF